MRVRVHMHTPKYTYIDIYIYIYIYRYRLAGGLTPDLILSGKGTLDMHKIYYIYISVRISLVLVLLFKG